MGLGADERGRISLKDFAARRHALKPQIGAICQKGNSSVGKRILSIICIPQIYVYN